MLSVTTGLLLIIGIAIGLFGVNRIFNRRRETHNAAFLVADRSAGWVKTSFSIAAAWVWAPALFIAAQQAYQNGWVGVFWFTVPNILCLVLFAFFAQKIRDQLPQGFTLPGYIEGRYGKGTQRVYAFCLLLLSLLSFAVQLLAGGLVIATLTGLPYLLVTILFAIIAVTYAYSSGLKASLITGTVKMLALFIVGTLVAIFVALNSGTVIDGLSGIKGDVHSLFSGAGGAIFWSFGLSATIGLMSGPFGDQAFWQRAFAVKRKYVKRSFLVGALLFAIVPLSMSVLGFALAGAGVAVDNLQLTNIAAITTWLPEWVLLFFVGAIIIGLLSTLDSSLCAAASIIGSDFSKPHQSLRNARTSMLVLAVLGIAIANIPELTIVKLFIIYGTLRASTLIPTLLIIGTKQQFDRRAISAGVIAALVIGLPLSAYGNMTSNVPFVVGGSIAVLVVSGIITVVGSRLLNNNKKGLING